MNAREAFKFGFVSRCVEQGLTTPEQMLAACETGFGKSAAFDPFKLLGAVGDTVGSAASWLIPAAIAAPPIAGYGLGRLAAKATDADDFDTDEAKRQELIDEYHTQAARARRQALVRKFTQARQQSGHMFL